MTSYPYSFTTPNKITNNFDYYLDFVKRLFSTTKLVGEKEDTLETLLSNRHVVEEIERTREDFKANHTNLKKYPRFNDKDWE